jgi:8-oxo-dGTP diphosphatase
LGRFLLQQRDDITGIIHPGKVGLFGGHREGDEAYLECTAREICEEISYFVPA